MTQKLVVSCILMVFVALGKVNADELIINHELEVTLNPAEESLRVADTLQFQPGVRSVLFTLHAGLNPQVSDSQASISRVKKLSGEVPLEVFRLQLESGQSTVRINYAGRISHGLKNQLQSPGRNQQMLTGTISEQGVFLDGRVAWYPRVYDAMQTFQMNTTVPEHWLVVSQGKGPDINHESGAVKVSWGEDQIQDDIYLVAAPFTFYKRELNGVEAQVYLREDDKKLAQRFLDITHHYLQLYSALIGDYPYAKFALVENFWESGYGMPSFTLLGSRVIRLPFILHSSYPHEILHNWWGNSVYIDYEQGNWSEGLTSYLADHLIREQNGKGVNYRRSALQRYANFVRSENDFKLREFRSRHSSSSQAVGYSKSMMMFHMLRRKLGDEMFIQGLRKLYKNHRLKNTGFNDVQSVFESVSRQNLDSFFDQWLDRTGAPELKVSDVHLLNKGDFFEVIGTLLQTHQGRAYELDVPIDIYLHGREQPESRTVSMTDKSHAFKFRFKTKPLAVHVDAEFDLFRALDPAEVPSSLGKLFGSKKIAFVLPAKANRELLEAYRNMAQQWLAGYDDGYIVLDTELDQLPEDREVWLLGWENRFYQDFSNKLQGHELTQKKEALSVAGHSIDKNEHSVVLTGFDENQQIVGWIGTDNAQSLPGLTRKLPHYGKYSYLVFQGNRPSIQHKGQWQISNTPLKINLGTPNRLAQKALPTPLWPK